MVTELADHRLQVRRVLIFTLILNLVVLGVKLSLGLATNSLSLLADALHSVTDSCSNILGLVALKFARPQPDREHPYGHQKFEALGALGIAAFLAIASFEITQGAFDRLVAGTAKVNLSGLELWLMLGVLGINIFVTYYERHIGTKLGSSILIADAHHTMADIWVTFIVMLGLVGVWLGAVSGWQWLGWLDVVLALPVAFLVFKSGWEVLQLNLPSLVDQMAIAPETIRAMVMTVEGVLNCHAIATRGILGKQIFIEMHLVVVPTDLESAHRITETVEDLLEQQFAPARVIIHLEPLAYSCDQLTYDENQQYF